MKSKLYTLLAAGLVMASAAMAADEQTGRSVGAYPVVSDDYPESSLVLNAGGDIVLTITGEARARFEWVENATDFSSSGFEGDSDDGFFDDNYSFGTGRFRLGLRFDMPNNVAAVIELQEGLTFGGGLEGNDAFYRALVNEHGRPGNANPHFAGYYRAKFSEEDDDDNAEHNSDHGDNVREDYADDTDKGVEVYQGYVEAANIGGSLLSVRVGRQEFAYGTEFLLGNQDFYDGLTWDGVKGIFEINDTNRLDLFWAKVAERDTSFGDGQGAGDDVDLFGAYYSNQSLGNSSVGMDAYLLALKDGADVELHVGADPDDIGDFFTHYDGEDGSKFLNAYWAGLRFFREREHGFHFSAELSYLFGEIEGDLDAPDHDLDDDEDFDFDISAWAFEGFLGYTWNQPTNPTFKGGITYATGTSNSDYARGEYKTFFTPSGDVHPRLGLMDLIDPSNVVAFTLGYSGSKGNHSWGVDLWYFESDEVEPEFEQVVDTDAYNDGHRLGDHVGNEIDLWYNYQYSKNLALQFAIGYFDPGSMIEDFHGCLEDFGDCDPSDPTTMDDGIASSSAMRIYANLLLRF